MSFRDDKIKILEMICADMLPFEACSDDQNVVLNEDDFIKEGFSFNSALLILKDIFSLGSINKFNILKNDVGKLGVHLTVKSDLESYTKILKYPETEYEDFEDTFESKPATPVKTPIVIDDKKGIYKIDDPEKCYKIQNPSARFSIVKALSMENKISLSELSKIAKHKSSTLTIKEIKKINDCFRNHLSLPVGNDLIVPVSTGGYSLNTDRFSIQPRS
jgi:hypothetical protein